jgi:hypothetical protein
MLAEHLHYYYVDGPIVSMHHLLLFLLLNLIIYKISPKMLAEHLHYYYVDGPIVWNLVLNSAFCTDNLQYCTWYSCVKLVLFILQIIENMQCENTLILPQIAMM